MTSKVEKTIAELLCCPYCLSYMYPPINQCLNGHNICHECYFRVLTCPTCRESKSLVARNYTLEAIFSILNLPCKYNDLGCDYISVGEKIRNHEDYCWYKKKKCPFATYDTCPWIDSMFSLRNHLLKSHSPSFVESRKNHFTSTNFKGISSYHYIFAVIYVYGKFFRLTWELEKSSKMTAWAVYFMGSPEEASNYSYKLEILSGAETKKENRHLMFKTVCDPKPENEVNDINKFGDHNCFYIHKTLLDKYCKTNGDLQYLVTIYKNIAKDQESTSTKSEAGMVQSEEVIEVSDDCQEISSIVKVEADKSCQ
uniref:E3 ubiquitin-protein ligase n=1 Tax=Diabrotica virgifera virgifera TaxID=50390 RepID=A0A6P7FD53_DIAVI